MKIFLTGETGSIGQWVVRIFIERGHAMAESPLSESQYTYFMAWELTNDLQFQKNCEDKLCLKCQVENRC